MSEASDMTGRVIRVSGPIVEAEGLAAAGAFEVVRVGPKGFIGEVIKLAGDVATIQVYEYTGGLQPGVAVERTGSPLSAVLAPGLLGSIFDGVQRPLTALADLSGTYVQPGVHADPLDTKRSGPSSRPWRPAPAQRRPDLRQRPGDRADHPPPAGAAGAERHGGRGRARGRLPHNADRLHAQDRDGRARADHGAALADAARAALRPAALQHGDPGHRAARHRHLLPHRARRRRRHPRRLRHRQDHPSSSSPSGATPTSSSTSAAASAATR